MLSKKQLELQNIARKLSVRPSYLGVHIAGNKAAVSDGIVYAEITSKASPQIPFGAIFPKGAMTLNLTGVKPGKKLPDMPEMENVFFSKEEAETATLFATDKTNKRIYEIGKIDDEFPDHSELIADAENQPIKIIVAGDELLKVAKLLKDFREVKINVGGDDNKAVMFKAEDGKNAAKVLLMKIKPELI